MARLMYLPFLATLLAVGVRGIPIHPAPHTDGPKHVWPTEFSAVCDPLSPSCLFRCCSSLDYSPGLPAASVLVSPDRSALPSLATHRPDGERTLRPAAEFPSRQDLKLPKDTSKS